MITAKILLDSINDENHRLTTWILRYNRFIHAEMLTHRLFSKNSASSRAIPTTKIVSDIVEDPALPVWWGKNQSGMQALAELEENPRLLCKESWLESRDLMISKADEMLQLGLHKQIANRVLEPWFHITVLLTATEFDNFFSLRAHKDAQPEFQELAYKMLDEYNSSIPKYVAPGQWHIPFGDKMVDGLSIEQKIKVCVARAARVSYNNFEGEINYEKDYELYDRLVSSGHASPTEHVAQAPTAGDTKDFVAKHCGNFRGWIQYRKLLKNECREDDRVQKYRVSPSCEVLPANSPQSISS